MTKSTTADEPRRVARVYDIANVGPRRRFIANGKVVSNCNWQNLPSTGDGANLRRAIMAPMGCKIGAFDASQVEARMTAWLAEFESKLDAFRAYDAGTGPDIYCVTAESVFGRPIDKDKDPFERFIGKVLELSCQYGAGAARVQNSLRQGFRGAEPVDLPIHEVKTNVEHWRHRANKPIPNYWKKIENVARRCWLQGDQDVELGPLVFEYSGQNGYIHLPNGTFVKYPNVFWDDQARDMLYAGRNGPTKLWGGLLLENVSQALCCALLKHHMLRIIDEMPYLFIALLVHDELVAVIDDDFVEEYGPKVAGIMSQPAPWCPDLPLNASMAVGDRYEKS